MGSSKKRGAVVDGSISKEQWKEHFRGQYIIGEETETITGERNDREDTEEADMQGITMEEIEETIKNPKKKKAAGQDQITNEAWIIGQEELKDDLRTILDGYNGKEGKYQWNGRQEQ